MTLPRSQSNKVKELRSKPGKRRAKQVATERIMLAASSGGNFGAPGAKPKPLITSDGEVSPHIPGATIEAWKEKLGVVTPELHTHEYLSVADRAAGRPKSMIRRAARMALADRLSLLTRIADAVEIRVYEVVTTFGKVIPVAVTPSVGERIKALELLARLGGLMDERIDGGEGATGPATMDLTQLSQLELEALSQLLTKAKLSVPTDAPSESRAQ
jgi:hypothetical protein